MRFLPLVNAPFVTVVDDDVYDLAARYRWWWRAQSNGRRGYVLSYGTHPPIRLHHLVLRPGPGHVVDHINRDTLDNRRCNLRLATLSQSNANRRMPRGRAWYRGVSPHRNRFRASIRVRGVRHHLGTYADKVDAARAYDRAARAAFGQLAVVNFPDPPKRPGPAGCLPWRQARRRRRRARVHR